MQAQTLQIFQNKQAVYGDAPERRAAVHLPAVGAGVESLFPDAVMHRAELIAEGRFCALYAAAGAVYHFRAYRYPVELRPQGSGLLTQGVVVRDSRNPGVALFAVQPAAADQFIHFTSPAHSPGRR